jgi:hypothetical protein
MPIAYRTIPLGGVDYAGRPLPPDVTYITGDQGDGLPGVPYKAPEPAEKPSVDGLPGVPYTAPKETAPEGQRQIGSSEALLSSLAHGATFGAAPAIEGLKAASGLQAPEGLDPNLPPEVQGDIAGGQSLARPFVGAFNLITGRTGPDTVKAYNDARDQALKEYEQTRAQHPYLTLAGELAGGLAATPVVPFAGLGRATSTLGRLAAGTKVGAVTGGLTGGGEAVSRGEGAGGVARSAGLGAGAGAILGAGLGGAIEGVSQTARKVASLRRGKFDPQAEAAKQVQEMFRGPGRKAVQRVTGDIPALRAGSETGAPMVVGDFGGRAAGSLLRSATDIAPEARDLAEETLGPRYRQQAPRIMDWIKGKFVGPGADVTAQRLLDQARRENAPAYKRAYTIAASRFPLGLTSMKLNELVRASPALRDALVEASGQQTERAAAEGVGRSVKQKLAFDAAGGFSKEVPDLQLWDYAQRILRDRAEGLRTAPGGTAKSQGTALGSIHRQLLAELDALVPDFARARGTAATFFGAADALEAGQKFVTMPGHLEGPALRAIRKMSGAERRLFAMGFAEEVANRLEGRGYQADVINNMYINSPRAARRIALALGPEAAAQFEAALRIENIMQKTHRAILGSQTSGNIAGMSKMGAAIAGGAELIHNLNPAYVIAGALYVGSREMARKIDEQVALHIAQMLLSDNPAVVSRGYDIMSRNPVIREALRRASDLTGRELISRFGESNVFAAELATLSHLPGMGMLQQKPPEHAPQQYDYEGQQNPVAPNP